jgi:hypothetical protein
MLGTLVLNVRKCQRFGWVECIGELMSQIYSYRKVKGSFMMIVIEDGYCKVRRNAYSSYICPNSHVSAASVIWYKFK